jgi:hypothetical protein
MVAKQRYHFPRLLTPNEISKVDFQGRQRLKVGSLFTGMTGGNIRMAELAAGHKKMPSDERHFANR